MLHLCSHCYHGDRLAGYGIDDQRHSYHDYRHDNQDVHNFPAGFFLIATFIVHYNGDDNCDDSQHYDKYDNTYTLFSASFGLVILGLR